MHPVERTKRLNRSGTEDNYGSDGWLMRNAMVPHREGIHSNEYYETRLPELLGSRSLYRGNSCQQPDLGSE